MRISSRAIIFKDNKVVLIYRKRDYQEYYVFPGGKVEDGETNEECVIRECKEELGIDIKPIKYVYEVKGPDFIQHFFLCEWVSGVIGTGDKEEYDVNRQGGVQIPMLIDIESLKKLNIVSPEIITELCIDMNMFGLNLDNNIKTIIEK